MMNCIVNFAPTGMIPTKKMTPSVPVTIDKIVEQVLEAAQIGITMVHLHARDEETGEPTYRANGRAWCSRQSICEIQFKG